MLLQRKEKEKSLFKDKVNTVTVHELSDKIFDLPLYTQDGAQLARDRQSLAWKYSSSFINVL